MMHTLRPYLMLNKKDYTDHNLVLTDKNMHLEEEMCEMGMTG